MSHSNMASLLTGSVCLIDSIFNIQLTARKKKKKTMLYVVWSIMIFMENVLSLTPTTKIMSIRKWFEPRSNIPWLKKIIWVTGVLLLVTDLSTRKFWRWLLHGLSKCQSLTKVLLRTPITQMIFFNQAKIMSVIYEMDTYHCILWPG